YDEITGQPYQKNIPERGWILPNGDIYLCQNIDSPEETCERRHMGYIGPYWDSEQVLGMIVEIIEYRDTIQRVEFLTDQEKLDVLQYLKDRGVWREGFVMDYYLIGYMS